MVGSTLLRGSLHPVSGSPTAGFEHLRHGGGVTVYVRGEIDLGERTRLRRVLEEAIRGEQVVRVDLADVAFMDSSGVHELARARRVAARRGTRFIVVSPPRMVRRLMHLWRDTDRFEIQHERADVHAPSG
jgi:anti-anti-sigma factor